MIYQSIHKFQKVYFLKFMYTVLRVGLLSCTIEQNCRTINLTERRTAEYTVYIGITNQLGSIISVVAKK